MASDPLEPPATPPESKAAIVDIFRSVDMPTSERQIPSSQSLMEECEVPTAPSSPFLPLKLPYRPPQPFPDEPDVDIDTEDSDPRIIEANQGKCALCFLDCSDFSAYSRVAHMNRCWSGLLQRVKEHKDRQERLARLQNRLGILIGKHKTKVQDASSLSSTSSVVDEAAATPLSIESFIASSPADDNTSISNSTTPSYSLPASIPPTNCLLCTISLTHLSPLDALAHRIYCLTFTGKCPTFCPICTADFHYPAVWDKSDITWHLHNCQNGGKLSPIDRDDFDALVAAWMGCMEVVERAVVGKVDGRAGIRVSEYKRKRDEGWARGEGWYAAEASKLRWGETRVNDEVEIVRVIETWTPTWFREQRFRRKEFCVLRVPEDERVFSRFKMQRVEKEVVYDEEVEEEEEEEEEEVQENVPRQREMPTWSLPSIYDTGKPTESRRMSVDSAMLYDTSGNDDYVTSHILSIPAKRISLPSIFDGDDSEATEEIMQLAGTKVSTAPTHDNTTNELENPSLPSLRPPPGLDRPLFSFADFDRLFDTPEDSRESAYTASIETKSQDDEIADDDAVSDSSGSTVSDHGMSDYYAAKEAAAREAASTALQNEVEPLEQEALSFPSDRLEGLPIVRLPKANGSITTPTQQPDASVHGTESRQETPGPSINANTATDFFAGRTNTGEKAGVILPHANLNAEEQAHNVDKKPKAMADGPEDMQEEEDDTDAHEDWLASRARAVAVLADRISPGSSTPLPALSPHSTPPPSRAPDFLCALELEHIDSDDMDTCYYYPPRGYLHENLRSSIMTYVSEGMAAEEVWESYRGVCVFGGVDELNDED